MHWMPLIPATLHPEIEIPEPRIIYVESEADLSRRIDTLLYVGFWSTSYDSALLWKVDKHRPKRKCEEQTRKFLRDHRLDVAYVWSREVLYDGFCEFQANLYSSIISAETYQE